MKGKHSKNGIGDRAWRGLCETLEPVIDDMYREPSWFSEPVWRIEDPVERRNGWVVALAAVALFFAACVWL